MRGLAALVVVIALGCGTPDEGPWGDTEIVDEASTPSVFMADDGFAVALFWRPDRLWARHHTDADGWSAPESVHGGVGRGSWSLDRYGRGIAAWTDVQLDTILGGAKFEVWSTGFDRTDGWSEALRLYRSDELYPVVWNEAVAVTSDDGTATILFTSLRGVWTMTRAPLGTWSEPTLLLGGSVDEPLRRRLRLVADRAGHLLAGWIDEEAGGGGVVRIMVFRPGAGWSEADEVPGTRVSRVGDLSDFLLAGNGDGHFAMVWRIYDALWILRLNVSPTRHSADEAHQASDSARYPRLLVDPSGVTTVAWSGRREDTSIAPAYEVHAAANTGWSAPSWIAYVTGDVQIAPSAEGGIFALYWAESNVLEVRRRTAAGHWGPPRRLAETGSTDSIAGSGDGHAIAMWRGCCTAGEDTRARHLRP